MFGYQRYAQRNSNVNDARNIISNSGTLRHIAPAKNTQPVNQNQLRKQCRKRAEFHRQRNSRNLLQDVPLSVWATQLSMLAGGIPMQNIRYPARPTIAGTHRQQSNTTEIQDAISRYLIDHPACDQAGEDTVFGADFAVRRMAFAGADCPQIIHPSAVRHLRKVNCGTGARD